MKNTTPDEKEFLAVCGLFCPACILYIYTREEPDRLAALARTRGCAARDQECLGCRSEKLALHCRACAFKTCAREHGVDFCGDCPEVPCEKLEAFQAEKPHRIELRDDHRRIKEVGTEKWYWEKMEHYACPDCRTINSAYDLTCRSCKAEPSCAYVELHGAAIKAHLGK